MKIEFKPKKVENFPYDKYVFQKYENGFPTKIYIASIHEHGGKISTISGSNADELTSAYCETLEDCEFQCELINKMI